MAATIWRKIAQKSFECLAQAQNELLHYAQLSQEEVMHERTTKANWRCWGEKNNCKGCSVHSLTVNHSCKCHVLYCRQLQKVTGHQIIASWPLSLFLTLSTAIYLCICLCHRSCLTPQPQPTLTLNPQLEIISKVWIRRYLATLASVFIGGMLDTLGISGPNF